MQNIVRFLILHVITIILSKTYVKKCKWTKGTGHITCISTYKRSRRARLGYIMFRGSRQSHSKESKRNYRQLIFVNMLHQLHCIVYNILYQYYLTCKNYLICMYCMTFICITDLFSLNWNDIFLFVC